MLQLKATRNRWSLLHIGAEYCVFESRLPKLFGSGVAETERNVAIERMLGRFGTAKLINLEDDLSGCSGPIEVTSFRMWEELASRRSYGGWTAFFPNDESFRESAQEFDFLGAQDLELAVLMLERNNQKVVVSSWHDDLDWLVFIKNSEIGLLREA
ncbi:hypothetical protein EU803_15810 [Loktanella sp. IMCC34160]|uniref:hypothetical protein n=1 Tax=Loktanella sp. IMCC34160 TaxID=2510646 RepID=UPI0010E4653A|nr:hypothetical protein [Loktanella sp. IMCC34160]RYG90077.1 hypothetical protein EU803_15810 [Loktanella sp. IMCC34160]